MVARKASSTRKPSAKKPKVLVFRPRDFTMAHAAIAALSLPPEIADAPHYVHDEAQSAKVTLFDAIAEAPVAKELTKRAFSLCDAILDLMMSNSDNPIEGDELERGFHPNATFEQVTAQFRADGFDVITVADLVAKVQKPRAEQASRKKVERYARSLGKELDREAVGKLVQWFFEGGAPPEVSSTLLAPFATLLLDETLETYSEREHRLLDLALRRRVFSGFAEDSDVEEGIGVDRMSLFIEQLRKAGFSEEEITDAWLDGAIGDRDWPSAKWFAMSLLPQLEPLAKRILGRADRVEPSARLMRLLVEPLEDLPDELEVLYRKAVVRFLAESELASAIGSEIPARLFAHDRKDFANASKKVKPLAPAPWVIRPTPRLAEVKRLYGIDFPEEVLAIWDLASSLSPKDPACAFAEEDDLGISLVGPFDILAGRARVKPGLDMRLHFRYRFDPPELFTVAVGNTDRLHFGYWLDDPAQGPSCVASYYVNDAYEMNVPGRTLGETIREQIESTWVGVLDNVRDDPQEAGTYVRTLARLSKLRERVMEYVTGDRKEIGEAYTEKYHLRNMRARQTIASTPEKMGIVAPESTWRAPSLLGSALRKELEGKAKRKTLVKEGLELAARGFAAGTLYLGRYCWAQACDEEAYTLLDAAYAGLHRPVLREVLALHKKHRDLKSVDVLEE